MPIDTKQHLALVATVIIQAALDQVADALPADPSPRTIRQWKKSSASTVLPLVYNNAQHLAGKVLAALYNTTVLNNHPKDSSVRVSGPDIESDIGLVSLFANLQATKMGNDPPMPHITIGAVIALLMQKLKDHPNLPDYDPIEDL